MNFHFPLMPRIFEALALADRQPILDILARTPPIPPSCQWATFLRCHDELTLEMVTPEEREFLWDYYAPEPRMRLNLGIRRRLAPLLGNHRARIELANSLLFTLTGSPVLYYGDEIGMGDNIWLEDRDGVRTPMQWSAAQNAGFSAADPDRLYSPVVDDPEYGYERVNVEAQQADAGSLLNRMRHLIQIRKGQPALARGDLQVIDAGNSAVLAYLRRYNGECLLIVNNLSADPQLAQLTLPGPSGEPQSLIDLLTGARVGVPAGERWPVSLAGYEYRWLQLD
jgi:maltose alpha-D-glucosyltransferase/alpha-amylase